MAESPDQINVPKVARDSILKYFHDDRGQYGVAATPELIQTSWYWKGCAKDVERNTTMSQLPVVGIQRRTPSGATTTTHAFTTFSGMGFGGTTRKA